MNCVVWGIKHQEKHKKLSDFIDFLALKHIILKLKVRKVAKSSYKVEKLQKVIKVMKSQKSCQQNRFERLP